MPQYKVSFSIRNREQEKYTQIFKGIDESIEYAKSLLFKPLTEEIYWGWNVCKSFIDNVSIIDAEYNKRDPSTKDLYKRSYNIWDDEFFTEIRLEHVHDLHWLLWMNYYEELNYRMKDGETRQFISVYWPRLRNNFDYPQFSENYVIVKTIQDNYNWSDGYPDLDKLIMYFYNTDRKETKEMLKNIWLQIKNIESRKYEEE